MLKFFFSSFFIYNSIQAYEYVKDKYSYQYEDWLINYSHGFVRRGLVGEFMIKFSQAIGANLQLIVFLFLILVLSVFYYQSFKLFSKLKHNFKILFLIFSPFFFFFYIVNHSAGIRKEFFIFIFFCYLVSIINIKNVKKNLWKFSCFFPVLILIHEGLFFYLSFYVLFVLFFLTNKNNLNSNFLQLVLTIITSSIIFYTSFIFKGSTEHVVSICNSLGVYVKETCVHGGAINQLKDKLIPAAEMVYREHNLISIIQWVLITFYSFLPILYLLKDSKFKKTLYLENLFKIKKTNLFIIFLLINCICILPLFFIAFDWGRWISIYYHLLVFVLIFLIKNKILIIKNSLIKINNKIIFIMILYSTFITPNVFDKISSNTENVYEFNYIEIFKKIN